jgi:hypothetical protein
MIGRWMSLSHFLICCTQLEQNGKVKTSFGGSPSKKGLFAVSSLYKVLVCNGGIYFPWKNIWRTKVPLRAAFFLGRWS